MYKGVEQLLVAASSDQQLQLALRFKACYSVQSIDAFYNPKTDVEHTFAQMLQMAPDLEHAEIDPELTKEAWVFIAEKMMKKLKNANPVCS